MLLETRLAEGLPDDVLDAAARSQAATLVQEGLLEPGAWSRGRAVLTMRGRLLADHVVRRLVS